MGHQRRKKDKLPKDVTGLTADEVLGKVFPKKVLREIQKEADKARDPQDKPAGQSRKPGRKA